MRIGSLREWIGYSLTFFVLLLIISPHLTGAVGTVADAMCDPVIKECECGMVPNPKTKKCEYKGLKYNVHNCPKYCVDTTNGQVAARGECIEQNRCKASECGGKPCEQGKEGGKPPEMPKLPEIPKGEDKPGSPQNPQSMGTGTDAYRSQGAVGESLPNGQDEKKNPFLDFIDQLIEKAFGNPGSYIDPQLQKALFDQEVGVYLDGLNLTAAQREQLRTELLESYSALQKYPFGSLDDGDLNNPQNNPGEGTSTKYIPVIHPSGKVTGFIAPHKAGNSAPSFIEKFWKALKSYFGF
jgi:hypothetical protein